MYVLRVSPCRTRIRDSITSFAGGSRGDDTRVSTTCVTVWLGMTTVPHHSLIAPPGTSIVCPLGGSPFQELSWDSSVQQLPPALPTRERHCRTGSGCRSADGQPANETLSAWAGRVAIVEQTNPRIVPETAILPSGHTIDVPGGAISEWCGTVVIPNHTVTQVVDTLVSSPRLPPANEVIESRILVRQGDTLKTYMKLTRHVLITATYDTEHDVRYERLSPELATSRSVSTRIQEIGGDDRGFMWRLNSYWRYQQAGHDVRIDVHSLTLSRRCPGRCVRLPCPSSSASDGSRCVAR